MSNYTLFFIALVPILWLIISLGILRIPAHKACMLGLGLTGLIAALVWKMPIIDVVTAALDGVALGLWPIMIVIIAAIFNYNLALYTKSMDVIKKMLSRISTDKRIQVLILAWGFGGFLEAVAGYGTAVAIPASILASLGFQPMFAAVICLIANTVPTAFGGVGVPVATLAKVTGLDVNQLSGAIGLQLSIFIIIIPFILVMMTTKSIKGIKGVFGITLVAGITFAVPQLLAAIHLGAELPAFLGSLFSLGSVILMAKLFYQEKGLTEEGKVSAKDAIIAWIPYIFIFIFIIGTSPLFPGMHDFLVQIKSNITIYTGEGATPATFKWIATPGVLIIFAALLGGLIQGAKLGEIIKVFGSTIKQLTKSMVTVLSIVALAKVMGYSGMITSIATVLVSITGVYFPIIAPIIGTLGTFVTGSDTSSNVLFGSLQLEVARSLGINEFWLAAANTSGATAGKMISPQSIAIATSATGLIGQEGNIFNQTVKFCLLYVLTLGCLVYFGSALMNLI